MRIKIIFDQNIIGQFIKFTEAFDTVNSSSPRDNVHMKVYLEQLTDVIWSPYYRTRINYSRGFDR